MQCQRLESSDIPDFVHSSDNAARQQADAEGPALVLHEANHRIRNMLAMIEAVMRHTQSASVEDYRAKVLTRISGFGQFHEVVGCWAGQNIALSELLKQTMEPCCAREGEVRACGPDVDLQPGLALALHLVFHELAMNSSKYGALTSPTGRVTVAWDLYASPGPDLKLAIVWTESGGPEVTSPERRGFGSRVITRALNGYGQVHLDFLPTGVACYMLIDLERWTPRSGENVHPLRPEGV